MDYLNDVLFAKTRLDFYNFQSILSVIYFRPDFLHVGEPSSANPSQIDEVLFVVLNY